MILSLNANEFDGINMRICILEGEIDKVDDKDFSALDSSRKTIQPAKYNSFKDIVSKTPKENLISKLAIKQKKFDVFAGLSITEELYGYIQDKEYLLESGAMNKSDVELTVKHCKNMAELYRTFIHFKNQLVSVTNTTSLSSQLNVDNAFTDSDGKQMNVASAIPIEEDDNDVSDYTIANNFKIYLDFLYTATSALGGAKNDDSNIKSSLPLLMMLWMVDSCNGVEEELGTLTHVKNKSEETPNKCLFPVKRKTLQGTYECTIAKQDRKLPPANTVTFKAMSECLKAACLRSYIKHKQSIEAVDKIDTDCFVFARYIFRMFKILGIDLAKNDSKKPFTREDINYRVLDTSNPNSLASLVPEYKFSPDFYNKTKSLKDWFTQTVEDIENEYDIEKYPLGNLNKEISQPVFNILNSSGSSKYPLTVQSKVGLDLDADIEVDHILQLLHLNKLMGTGISSDLYSELLNSKRDRAILFEPILTMTSRNTVNKNNITSKVQAAIEGGRKDIYYRALGLDIMIKQKIINIINLEYATQDTPDDTKFIINGMIDTKINEIAEDYMRFYFERNWNFPFMARKSDLVSLIKNTLMIDRGSNFLFLLGDCLTLYVQEDLGNGRMSEPIECAVTSDYKFVTNNRVYIPFIYEEEIIIEDEEGQKVIKASKIGIRNIEAI